MNLIYQYWIGTLPAYAKESSKIMKSYADFVGADYRFDLNPNFSFFNDLRYFNKLSPVYESGFEKYENIIVIDLDIFPKNKTKKNIFEEQVKDIGLCEEVHQPEARQFSKSKINNHSDNLWSEISRKKWGTQNPRDSKNRCRVFNTGLIFYSRPGLEKAKKHFVPIKEYISAMKDLHSFYSIDQNYLTAMVFTDNIDFSILPYSWNSQIYYYYDEKGNRSIFDGRSDDTNLVHMQIRGRDKISIETMVSIVNDPIEVWRDLV